MAGNSIPCLKGRPYSEQVGLCGLSIHCERARHPPCLVLFVNMVEDRKNNAISSASDSEPEARKFRNFSEWQVAPG